MTQNNIKKPLFIWFFGAVAVTGVFSGVYLATQQVYRQSANDPQIMMAEDAASRLEGGEVPAGLVARGVPLIDITDSISPWLAVYDNQGMPLESSAQLHNLPPQFLKVLFNTATWIDPKTYDTPAGKETRITWQPEPGVRQAIVLVEVVGATQAQTKYVVVGRSLRDTEDRTRVLGINLLLAWAFTLFCLGVLSFLKNQFLRK